MGKAGRRKCEVTGGKTGEEVRLGRKNISKTKEVRWLGAGLGRRECVWG